MVGRSTVVPEPIPKILERNPPESEVPDSGTCETLVEGAAELSMLAFRAVVEWSDMPSICHCFLRTALERIKCPAYGSQFCPDNS